MFDMYKKMRSNLGGTRWFSLRKEKCTQIQFKRGLEPGWLGAFATPLNQPSLPIFDMYMRVSNF